MPYRSCHISPLVRGCNCRKIIVICRVFGFEGEELSVFCGGKKHAQRLRREAIEGFECSNGGKKPIQPINQRRKQ